MGTCSRLAASWLSRLGLVVCLGCSVPAGPELLEVSAASPGLVEPGGALRIAGRGFPAGRTGQIELRGTRLVPGRDPEEVTMRWSAQAVSSARLEATLSEEHALVLTEGAPHATFRGRLSIAFEPVRVGAPALRGHLKDVTLDVLAPAAPASTSSDFAHYVGLVLGPDLTVISLVEGLEAHAAGVRIGDRMHRLDGVRLLTMSDFAPRAHGSTSLLEYSRAGFAGHAEVLLERADYFRSDESVIWLTLSAALAALIGLLAAARPPRAAIWLLQAGRRGELYARALAGLGVGWTGVALRAAMGAAVLVLLLRAGTRTVLPDLPLLAAASLGALLLAALVQDGRASGGRFSLSAGLFAASLAALGLMPLALAWGLAAFDVGSLSLVELSLPQAGAPLGSGLLASTWTLLSAGAYFFALVPAASARSGAAAGRRAGGFLVRALEELGLGLALLVWVVLYGVALGKIPTLGWTLGLCFAELCLAWTALLALRGLSAGANRRETWHVLGWPVALTGLVAALARLLLHRLDEAAVWEARLRWLPLFCLLSVCVWLTLSASRSLSHHGRRADPWL